MSSSADLGSPGLTDTSRWSIAHVVAATHDPHVLPLHGTGTGTVHRGETQEIAARTTCCEGQEPRSQEPGEGAVNTPENSKPIDRIVQAHIDGTATAAQLAQLKADQDSWVESLFHLLDAAEGALERARQDERGQMRVSVLNDLDDECLRIDNVLTELIGPAPDDEPASTRDVETESGTALLQLSWNPGVLLAWAGGHKASSGDSEQLATRLDTVGASTIPWADHGRLKIGTGQRVATVTTPLGGALGWLVAFAAPSDDSADDEQIAPSARWMGRAAATAVSLVARGRMAPQLRQSRGKSDSDTAVFNVRWQPALIDPDMLADLVTTVPGAAMIGQQRQDADSFVGAVLADLTDVIVRTAAGQIDLPAPPPEVVDRNDIGESVVTRLDGSSFSAPASAGAEIVRRLNRWAAPIVATAPRLIVKLGAPDLSDAWLASVLVQSTTDTPDPLEVALAGSSKGRAKALEQQAARLERLFPALLRPGGRRRGEVILSQDEAWQLMTDVGPMLESAGFDVRVPPLSRKRATASLRLTAGETDSVVGAQQLANVRWSAVFDDVELTAAEIAKLAEEARPLVQSRGEWIELDQADLAEAAAALAERADVTHLTGADMLRHAMGLEGSPLAGGISIAGDGWAADLLRSVGNLSDGADLTPPGFTGELRTYQADALSWLNFLDEAGLGGCLALDMGLGKTPTTLAVLAAGRAHGLGLVIAPPAVVGNWAAEAERFVPGVKIHVHHGASRLKGPDLESKFGDAEVIITTYGTAVRDMDELAAIQWGKVVIDEAQAIKNPSAETSQQLRRLDARTRLALTGTPIENGLGDLWAIMDWANPGLVGARAPFIAQLTPESKGRSNGASGSRGEEALKALNGILIYRRTKLEPEIAAELPDRIDEIDHCAMTPEQIGLYQAVVDSLVVDAAESEPGAPERKGAVLAAITALKQICNHPVNYQPDDEPLEGRSGKLLRLHEILESVFAADEKVLIFTHFATWGERLAGHLSSGYDKKIMCYHGGLSRGARDRMIDDFQDQEGAGALVLSLKAGGTGLNLTAANHVVLYDRWWNPAVEDQARDRVWRIGQTKTVICHRLVCPGTVDERVEEIVEGKRHIANMVLPKSSSVDDLDAEQIQTALGIDPDVLLNIEQPDEEVVGVPA